MVCRKGLAILAFVKCFNIVFYDSKSPFFTTIGGIPSWELTYPIKNHVWRWFSFCQGGIFLYVSSRKGGYFVSLNHHPLGIFCRNLSQWIEAKTFDSTPVVDSWGKKNGGGQTSVPLGIPKGSDLIFGCNIHPRKLIWIPENDGLEKVDSFEIWPFLVSMLDFRGVNRLELIQEICVDLLYFVWVVCLFCLKDGFSEHEKFRVILMEFDTNGLYFRGWLI